MRIAIITGRFPARSETFVYNQVKGLMERGHKVTIYSLLKGEEVEIEGKMRKRIVYCGVPKNKILRVVKHMGYRLKAYLDLASWDNLYFEEIRVKKYGKCVITLMPHFLISAMGKKGENYDILYANFGVRGIVGVVAKDILYPKSKLVTSFAGGDITHFVNKNGKGVYDALKKKGDWFIANTEFTKNTLINEGFEKEKIEVIGMGINTKVFKRKK